MTTITEVLVSFMLQTHPQHMMLKAIMETRQFTDSGSTSRQQRVAFVNLAFVCDFASSSERASAAFTAVELGSFEKWKEAVGK